MALAIPGFKVWKYGYLLEIKARGFKYEELGKNLLSWVCHSVNKNIIHQGGQHVQSQSKGDGFSG
jgi:hypothetical protein